MWDFEKHLAFYYGDLNEMEKQFRINLKKYEAIENKTPAIEQRIENYKYLLAEIKERK